VSAAVRRLRPVGLEKEVRDPRHERGDGQRLVSALLWPDSPSNLPPAPVQVRAEAEAEAEKDC